MRDNEAFRLCIFLDVSAYSRRSARDQMRVQAWLTQIVNRALATDALESGKNLVQQQGDGCLVLIDPRANLTAAVRELIAGLVEAVAWVNEPLREEYRIKVRVAMDAGVVRHGQNGYVGRAVTGVARLVNAAPLREAVAAPNSVETALICSDTLYRDVIEDDARQVDSFAFSQVVVEEKEFMNWAWLFVPPSPHSRQNAMMKEIDSVSEVHRHDDA